MWMMLLFDYYVFMATIYYILHLLTEQNKQKVGRPVKRDVSCINKSHMCEGGGGPCYFSAFISYLTCNNFRRHKNMFFCIFIFIGDILENIFFAQYQSWKIHHALRLNRNKICCMKNAKGEYKYKLDWKFWIWILFISHMHKNEKNLLGIDNKNNVKCFNE